ncbi:MAG: divalent-cation tolerance protein CutA [Chthoniobacteraceae bacterium]
MSGAESAIVAFSTFADAETARKVVRMLVEERLVACGNILPQVESIYRWQGRIESNAEVIVIFKTTRARYADFEQRLRALHPYEVPEIIALNSVEGLPAYLQWIADSVSPDPV